MRLLSLLAASLIPASTFAVFADEAFQIDYHHALLGIPQEDNTFIHQPVASSRASLLFTLTDKSLFGAVNPKDGSIVWRQQLHSVSNSSNAVLRAGGDNVLATAAGSQVATWQASDGRLIWSHDYGQDVVVKDAIFLDVKGEGSAIGSQDILVLYQGASSGIERRDLETGEVKWQYTDASSDSASKLGLTGATVHLVSLHGTILGAHKIRVSHVDVVTGQLSDQHTLSDSDIAADEDILYVGSGSAVPIVAWTDKSFESVRVNILGTKSVLNLVADKKTEEIQSIKVHAPKGLNAAPHFLVQYTSNDGHWAEIYHINVAKGSISKAYDLPRLAGKGAFASSVSEGSLFFTRIAADGITVTASGSDNVLERKPLTEYVPTTHGSAEPVFAASEVMARPDGSPAAVRVAVLLSSGDWALFLNGELAWSRPEALTLAESVVFVEAAQGERLARELAIEEHASIERAFTHRLTRHIEELKSLPKWLETLPARITDSLLGKSIAKKNDKFGFNKLVVVATSNGRLIGLDAGNGGQLVWNQAVPEYVPSTEWKAPTLTASAPGIVRVKTATGHWVFGRDGKILRKGSDTKEKSQVSSTVSFDIVDNELKGFSVNDKKAAVWTYKPLNGERILSVTSRPVEDPVAQIGIVLGDRSVLYKYLNPNTAAIITGNEAASSISAIVIDTVSGNVLYEAKHPGVDVTRPIPALLSENWLTYSYTLKSGPITPSRGHILVTAHFLESAAANDRGPLGSSGNYSSFSPLAADAGKPYTMSQSFQIPEEISSFSVSHTRQGITSRMILAVIPGAAGIVGIPIQFLDPRRPIGRDPTATEAMEGLIKYNPILEFNPQWYLSHQREVLGVEKVVTSPAVLESTSLLFAYGCDIFGTRVSPSFTFDVLGKGFNKVQMLLTVVGLFVGVVFVAPLVKRKQTNTRWSM